MTGYCDFCKDTVSTTDALMHAAVHGWTPEELPDDGMARLLGDIAALPATRWGRFRLWLTGRFA